jgi:hypothetical protein
LVALTIMGPVMAVESLAMVWGGVRAAWEFADRRAFVETAAVPPRVEAGELSAEQREWVAEVLHGGEPMSAELRAWQVAALNEVPLPLDPAAVGSAEAVRGQVVGRNLVPRSPQETGLQRSEFWTRFGVIIWTWSGTHEDGELSVHGSDVNGISSYSAVLTPTGVQQPRGHWFRFVRDRHRKPHMWEIVVGWAFGGLGLAAVVAWLVAAWAAGRAWAAHPAGPRLLRRGGRCLAVIGGGLGLMLGLMLTAGSPAGWGGGRLDDAWLLLGLAALLPIATGVITQPVAERAGRVSGAGT